MVITRQKSPYTSECMSEWDEVPYTEYLDVSEAGRYSINVSVFLRLITTNFLLEIVSNIHGISSINILWFQECKRACFFQSVIEKCGCFHPLFLDFDENKKGYQPCNQTQYCKIWNNEISNKLFVRIFLSFEYDLNKTLSQLFIATDSNCTAQVVYRLDSGNPKCECGVGCLDRHYVKQLSIATWPSNQYLVSFRYILHKH